MEAVANHCQWRRQFHASSIATTDSNDRALNFIKKDELLTGKFMKFIRAAILSFAGGRKQKTLWKRMEPVSAPCGHP